MIVEILDSIWEAISKWWNALPPPNPDPHPHPYSKPYRKPESGLIAKMIGGAFAGLCYVGIPLGILYFLVRFVKWAWEN